MEVCCLKMASRCRPTRPVLVDVTRLPTVSSSHNCGSLSRVVMVRKTDQRMINHKKPQSDPQCEIVTFETIQTYRGHKPERTVITKESHDLNESEIQKSPSAQRFLRSNHQSATQSLAVSTNDISYTTKTVNGNYSNSSRNSTKSPSPLSLSQSPLASARLKQKSPSPPIKQSGIFTEFEKDCLRAHNEYRLKHCVKPLKLSKRLCRYAEEWAKIIASRGTPIHRNNSPYGENIFCSWSSNSNVIVKGNEPVEHWYEEGVTHVFGKEPATLKTGHFTQVVWKDSRDFGVGQAKNRSGQVFIVANYDPPGNFIGSFAENVPPIGGFPVPSDTPRITIDNVPDSSLDSSFEFDKDDVDMDRFAKAILKYHNEYRRKHSVPELVLSKKLCIQSQNWASELARDDRFAYCPHINYGENIYCLWSSDRNAKANPKDVCRSWYEEIKEYNFGSEPKGVFKAGHFTQMIWKLTKEIGVGVAKTKEGKVLVVCNYDPRGNIVGQFGNNVFRGR